MTELELPTLPVGRKTDSPENIIIYSKPKVGKTTKASELSDYLIMDLEKGSDKIDCVKVQANSLQELQAWITMIRKKNTEVGGYAYKYLIVDTLTELEAWCEWDATVMYMKTPIGKNFNRSETEMDPKTGDMKVLPRSQWDSVLTLPKGAGYLYLRNSFKKWMNILMDLSPHVIFYAHLKDGSVERKGKEVAVKDLDLTGKIKTIAAQKVDAIGYAYWEEGKLMLSFSTRDGVEASSRCEHLRDQIIEWDWNIIFVD